MNNNENRICKNVNCNNTFAYAKHGGNTKKFCSSKCRKNFHDADGGRMTTTPTTTETTTTDNVSKSLGNSLTNRALRPALELLGAASGLGVIGTVGASVATDVVSPMVKDGINKGEIMPVGTTTGGFLGYMLTRRSEVCETSSDGLKTSCKKNYLLNGAVTVGGAFVGNWIEKMIRNWLSSVTTTPTTTETTTTMQNVTINQSNNMGVNIDDLMKMEFKYYDMSGDFWGLAFGERVQDPFNVIAYGSPGGGKTTMSLMFADYFGRKFGKVKYLSAEMGLSNSLKDMVKRLGMTSKKVFFDKSKKPLNELINELKKGHFKMLIIDSANFVGYSAEDIEMIKNSVQGLSTFIILQSTKDGKFRGANDYAHNADVILKVVDLEVFTEKTRFAAKNVAGMPII